MRCGFCGHDDPNLINFCDRCGQPLQQANRSKLFGVLLIIFGVLPGLIPTQLSSLLFPQASVEYLSARSAITLCPELFSIFLFNPSKIIAVIAGCMLLKKGTNPRSALLTCSIIQIISFVFYWSINMTMLVAPEVLLQAFVGSASATVLLQNAPELLLLDHLYWGLRMLLTAGITVISFVALTKTGSPALLQTQRQPFIGILLTFIVQPWFAIIHILYVANYGVRVRGGYAEGAAFYSDFSDLVAPCMGIALLILAVMLTRRKAGVLHGVVMGGLALFAFTAIIQDALLLVNARFPHRQLFLHVKYPPLPHGKGGCLQITPFSKYTVRREPVSAHPDRLFPAEDPRIPPQTGIRRPFRQPKPPDKAYPHLKLSRSP